MKDANVRILILHDGSRLEGGASRMLLTVLRGFASETDSHVAAVLSSRGELGRLIRKEASASYAIRQARINSTGHFPMRPGAGSVLLLLRYLLNRGPASRDLDEIIRKERPALIHLFTSSMPWAAAVSRRHCIPHIVHLHDFPRGPAGRFLLSRSIEGAGGVIAVSKAVARRSADVHREIPRWVMYNPVDPARFEPSRNGGDVRRELNIGKDEKVVFFGGQIIPAKGSRLLVPIMEELGRREPGCVLLVAGRSEPPEGEGVQSRVRRALAPFLMREDRRLEYGAHTSKGRFRALFCGYREDVVDLMAASNAGLLPNTEEEPFGLVAEEASTLGLPLVLSRVDSFAERFREGEKIRLVEPGDTEGFAVALSEFMKRPVSRMNIDMGELEAGLVAYQKRLAEVYRMVIGSRP